jgi:hypothetical protein
MEKWVKIFAVLSTVVTGFLFIYNGFADFKYGDSSMPNITGHYYYSSFHGITTVTNDDEQFFTYFVLTKLIIGFTLIGTALYVGYNWGKR